MTPLKPVDFLILLSLVAEDRHGYGILLNVSELTNGEVQLDPGNLYRCLKRMLDAKLVRKSSRRPAADADDERRQYYQLTPLGRKTAASEAQRMVALLSLDQTRALLAEAKS